MTNSTYVDNRKYFVYYYISLLLLEIMLDFEPSHASRHTELNSRIFSVQNNSKLRLLLRLIFTLDKQDTT